MLTTLGKDLICRLQKSRGMLNLDDLVKLNLEISNLLHNEYARRKVENLKELGGC